MSEGGRAIERVREGGGKGQKEEGEEGQSVSSPVEILLDSTSATKPCTPFTCIR